MANSGSSLDGRPVGVEHHWNAAPARRLADRPHEIRKPVVGEQQRHAFDQRAGFGRQRRFDPRVAIGRDHALASSVDHDPRHRRGRAGDTHHALGADAFAGHLGHQLIADRVGGVAERAGVVHAAAEARQRDRGVDGAAAEDDAELVGHALAAGRRELLDAEHQVLHRDAGAQHRRCASKTACSLSTHSRMM